MLAWMPTRSPLACGSDAQFRRRALHDPPGVVAEHHLDVPGLKVAARLLGHPISEDDGWCANSMLMFALIASVLRGD